MAGLVVCRPFAAVGSRDKGLLRRRFIYFLFYSPPPQCPERRRGRARIGRPVDLVVDGDGFADGRLLLEFCKAEVMAKSIVGSAAGDHTVGIVVGCG